jgi:hypothetical protein
MSTKDIICTTYEWKKLNFVDNIIKEYKRAITYNCWINNINYNLTGKYNLLLLNMEKFRKYRDKLKEYVRNNIYVSEWYNQKHVDFDQNSFIIIGFIFYLETLVYNIKSFMDLFSQFVVCLSPKHSRNIPDKFNRQRSFYKKNDSIDPEYSYFLENNLEWYDDLKKVRDLITHYAYGDLHFTFENDKLFISWNLMKKKIDWKKAEICIYNIDELSEKIETGFYSFLEFCENHFTKKFLVKEVRKSVLSDYENLLKRDKENLVIDIVLISSIRKEIEARASELTEEDKLRLTELDKNTKEFIDKNRDAIKEGIIFTYSTAPKSFFQEEMSEQKNVPEDKWWFRLQYLIIQSENLPNMPG